MPVNDQLIQLFFRPRGRGFCSEIVEYQNLGVSHLTERVVERLAACWTIRSTQIIEKIWYESEENLTTQSDVLPNNRRGEMGFPTASRSAHPLRRRPPLLLYLRVR